MSKLNGSGEALLALQAAARNTHGNASMTTEGVLFASLRESVAKKHDPKADRDLSKFWDRACFNAIRVMCGLDPLEDFK